MFGLTERRARSVKDSFNITYLRGFLPPSLAVRARP